ncbi:hypothetical protein ZYGR_0I04480 [Zygosaccharomyces rouxii]|uniref:INO80 complex subunit B-like conserved region domain-containing protein n=1 Tax=Zygosaccharomyces rouxii TaxID=4956 RepID=A0A1Q2ZXG6_ZYGRO|nr:hypothetical protein ZYGR_0I04480 [Zygosaccharomyces rouxii]
MDSDYSDSGSESLEPAYRPGADDDDDNEEYIEVQHTPKRSKPRANKRSKTGNGGISRSSNNRRRRTREIQDEDAEAEAEEELELEQMSSPRKRGGGGTQVVDEEEEDEEDAQELSPEPKMFSEDVEVEDEIPAPTAVEEEELRETTEESMKPNGNGGASNGTKSKMLTELLGDGSTKKIMTEEEIALRRAENARKRKNLSEKRLEEEKQETINKLLRRRAGKSRSHVDDKEDENSNNTGESGPNGESLSFSRPRRPYISKGMNRTLRKPDVDLYCSIEFD